jgi:hypothetical protein
MVEWVYLGGDGAEQGVSERFANQAEAEAWFGTAWESLADAGTAEVVLRDVDGGREIYRMSLSPG